MGWKQDLWAPFTDESLAKVTVPQLASLSVLGQQLVLPDGHLTPQGWGAASALVSSVVCLALYKLTRPLTYALFGTYRKLSHNDRRNWDSRYSSNIHAVLCVYFAYYCVWDSDLFWKADKTPQILRTSAQTYIGLGMSFGYFFIDFISCVKYMMGGAEMLLHHLGSLLAVTTALLTGDAHMHTLWMLVTEFTTPLINNRWWLDKMELKHTSAYVVNGLAVLFCWVPARLMVFPPFFYVVWQHRQELWLITTLSKFLVAVVPTILTTLNVYWFTRIVLGAYKVLFGKKKAKVE